MREKLVEIIIYRAKSKIGKFGKKERLVVEPVTAMNKVIDKGLSKSSNKELQLALEYHWKKIHAKAHSGDIVQAITSELSSRETRKVSYLAVLIAGISLFIACAGLDYWGDKEWQSQQIKVLKEIKENTSINTQK